MRKLLLFFFCSFATAVVLNLMRDFPLANAAEPISLSIISPQGTDKWRVGDTHSIRWNQTNVERISISLSRNGIFIRNITPLPLTVSKTASIGEYSWTIPLDDSHGTSSISAGTGYTLQLVGASNSASSNAIVESQPFELLENQSFRPDFVIESIKVGTWGVPSPSDPTTNNYGIFETMKYEDSPNLVFVTFKNQGTKLAELPYEMISDLDIGITINGVYQGNNLCGFTSGTSQYKAGETATLRCSVGVFAPGSYNLIAQIDDQNKVVELRDDNNTFTKSFTIIKEGTSPGTPGSGTFLPDVRITNVKVVKYVATANQRYVESRITDKDTASISVGFVNTGNKDLTGTIPYRYQAGTFSGSGVLKTYGNYPVVPGGAEQLPIQLGIWPVGSYVLKLTLDPENTIPELDDHNNSYEVRFLIESDGVPTQTSKQNTTSSSIANKPSASTQSKGVVNKEKTVVKNVDIKLVSRLKGSILLAVESNGQVWYVDHKTGKRFYLKDGPTAFGALRKFGTGIATKDLEKIPVGAPDQPSIKPKVLTPMCRRMEGNIYLQVESKGEAWYIHNCKRYYLKDGEQAYQIMRKLSLGITNENLRKIAVGELN